MRLGVLTVVTLLISSTNWAAVQFDGPVTEVSSLVYQGDSTIAVPTPGIQNLDSPPSSWQLRSLSYAGSSALNLDGAQGGIQQTAVPEPAFTGLVLAAICAAFVVGRKRTQIARFLARN